MAGADAKVSHSEGRRMLISGLLEKYCLDEDRWTQIFKEKLQVTKLNQLQHVPEEEFRKLVHDREICWEEQALNGFIAELKVLQEAKSAQNPDDLKKLRTETKQKLMSTKESAPSVDFAGLHDELKQARDGHCSRRNITAEIFDNYKPTSGNISLPFDQECMSPEGLITKISGGKLMCGMYVTKHIATLKTETDPVFKCPNDIHFYAPSLEEKQEIIEINSKEQHTEFNHSISSVGFSIASQIVEQGWITTYGDFDIGGTTNINTQVKKTVTKTRDKTYISKSMCHVIPVCAIRFNIRDMKMEDNLLASFRQLEEMLSSETCGEDSLQYAHSYAESLFKRFGSHVNRGLVHLGGIYMHNGTYESEVSTVGSCTEDMVMSAVQSSFSSGFQLMASNLAVSVDQKLDASHGKTVKEYEQKELAKIKVSVLKQGGVPSAKSLQEWQSSLLHTNKYLAVIDRGADFESGFGGIWELIANHCEEFKYPKGLEVFLKYSWFLAHGNIVRFRPDTENHAAEFIEMVLLSKIDYLKANADKLTLDAKLPIVNVFELCQQVTGSRNMAYKRMVGLVTESALLCADGLFTEEFSRLCCTYQRPPYNMKTNEQNTDVIPTVRYPLSGVTWVSVTEYNQLRRGDHIVFWQNYFWHHAIVQALPGNHILSIILWSLYNPREVVEMTVTLGEDGVAIQRAQYTEGCYHDDLVVHRAQARLGEDEYGLVTNFARAFPEWCKTGVGRLTHDDAAADERYRQAVSRKKLKVPPIQPK